MYVHVGIHRQCIVSLYIFTVSLVNYNLGQPVCSYIFILGLVECVFGSVPTGEPPWGVLLTNLNKGHSRRMHTQF